MRGPLRYSDCDVWKDLPAAPAQTVPTNIWTLDEFAALITANMEEALLRGRVSTLVSDEEVAKLTGVICARCHA